MGAVFVEKVPGGYYEVRGVEGAVYTTYKLKREAEQQIAIGQALVAAFVTAGSKRYSRDELMILDLVYEVERLRGQLLSGLRSLQAEVARDAERVAAGWATWNSCRSYADRGSDLSNIDAEHRATARMMQRLVNAEIRRNPTGDVAVACAVAVFFCAGEVR